MSRGRPTNPEKQAEQKQKLVNAAQMLLREKSYKSITIRELAERANVNSAMIRYYFESKEGLFLAVFQQMSTSMFSQVQSVVNEPEPIKSLIHFLLTMLKQEQGLVRFIHDEVLQSESALSSAFIDGFPKRMAAFLPMLIEKELKKRSVTTSINTTFAAFNLVSMLFLPIVAAPVRRTAWGISDDVVFSEAWETHIYEQFMSGCLRRERGHES